MRVMFALVALGSALVFGAACGSADGSDARPDQPAPRTSKFTFGGFDDLPHYPRSEPLSPAIKQDGLVVRSYAADSALPETVLRYYTERLGQPCRVLTAPRRYGNTAWRGIWECDGRQLLVAAAPAPALDEVPSTIDAPSTQYTLTLAEPGVAVVGPDPGG